MSVPIEVVGESERLTSDTVDVEAGTDLSGQFPLGPAQHNVQELLLSGNGRDVLPSGLHLGHTGRRLCCWMKREVLW